MNNQELIKKVRDLKELKIMLYELQNEISSIEDEIKQEMTSNNQEEIVVDIYKIRYKEIKSNKFDTVSFKKVYMDLYNQFTKEITTKRFSIA